MGTECALYLFTEQENLADEISDLAVGEVLRIEAKYSRYLPDSDLSKINRVAAKGGSIDVDEETAALIDYAFACYRQSGGLFDITSGLLRQAWDFSRSSLPEQSTIDTLVPLIGLSKLIWQNPSLTFASPGMEIDFGGIGKEYAADRVAELCETRHIDHGLIDLGGDIRVIGAPPASKPWSIQIRDPKEPTTAIASLPIVAGAIATSGNYERYIDVGGKRYCHILNPMTGWPTQGLSSVTVTAQSCMVAGSLSTIAMLKGKPGIEWLASLGVPHLWIDEQGERGGNLFPSDSHQH